MQERLINCQPDVNWKVYFNTGVVLVEFAQCVSWCGAIIFLMISSCVVWGGAMGG